LIRSVGLNSWARGGTTTKVNHQPSAGRAGDGHQRSSGSNQACGPLPEFSADVFQGVVLEVDELLRAEVERGLTVGSASGPDDVGTGLSVELRHHRSDSTRRTVQEDALPGLKASVHEQSWPYTQA